LIINSETNATLNAITFIDFFSKIGPFLALVDLNYVATISDINFICSQPAIYLPIKFFLTWSATVTLINIFAQNFINNGFINILYKSNVKIFSAKLNNFNCQTSEKGCIALINSESSLEFRNSTIYNTYSNKPIFSADHSQLFFELIECRNNSMSGFPIDMYVIFSELSNVSFRNITGSDFSGGFGHFIITKVSMEKIVIKKSWNFAFLVSSLYFEGCHYITLEGSLFLSLKAEYGGVKKIKI
jgi:hypothetical protein